MLCILECPHILLLHVCGYCIAREDTFLAVLFLYHTYVRVLCYVLIVSSVCMHMTSVVTCDSVCLLVCTYFEPSCFTNYTFV